MATATTTTTTTSFGVNVTNTAIAANGTNTGNATSNTTTATSTSSNSSTSSSSVSFSLTISSPAGTPTTTTTTTTPSLILNQCEGICQQDMDCAEGLICYRQNNLGEDIPYCYFPPQEENSLLLQETLRQSTSTYNGATTRLNVCTLPPTNPPTIAPTTLQPTNQPTRIPYDPNNNIPVPATFVGQDLGTGRLGHCEGDCDDDRECADDLICWQRSRQEDGAPGCFVPDVVANKQLRDDTDLCIDLRDTNMPTASPTLGHLPTPGPPPPPQRIVFVGNPADRLLQHCECDCDSDNDCHGDLFCLEREDSDDDNESATGCYSDANDDIPSDVDICIDRNYSLGSSLVRLRLYWEDGYYWQEDRDEQYWCLRQRGNSVDLYDCDSGDRQQIFEMIYLHTGEALIRSTTRDECLEGRNSKDSQARFEECNLNDDTQKFIPMKGGWGDKHFELTRIEMYGKLCLTNHHHPRSGEEVEMRDCDQERSYTTSAWQFWW